MTTITTELAQRMRKLSSKIVENLVSCDSADEEAEQQYLEWTLKTVSGFVKRELKAKDKQIADAKVLAEVESKGADKAATEGVEWMKRCHAAEKRVEELEAEVKFPGVMRCKKCDFSRTHINVHPSGMSAGESVPEHCPNGCGPLWNGTYRQQYNELYDAYKQLQLEARAEQQPVGEAQRNPVLAYADSYRGMADKGVSYVQIWGVITDLERNIAPLFTAPPAPAQPLEFLPENLDRALTVLGVALPVSKEEFNLEAERWMQRLINRVIRLDSELIPPAPAPVTVKLPEPIGPEAAPAHYWGEGESMAYADGYNAGLKAAGIKIAEGE